MKLEIELSDRDLAVMAEMRAAGGLRSDAELIKVALFNQARYFGVRVWVSDFALAIVGGRVRPAAGAGRKCSTGNTAPQ